MRFRSGACHGSLLRDSGHATLGQAEERVGDRALVPGEAQLGHGEDLVESFNYD